MIVGLFGSSGHMGLPTLEEFLKIEEIDYVKVLLEKKYSRNKLVKRLAKKNPGRIHIYYGNVSNKEDVLNVVQGCSYLFNLAGAIPPRSELHPEDSYAANELGVKNIIEVIEQHPEIRLIDITTMALYGHHKMNHPFQRVGDPLFPGVYDFYTTHKLRGEFALLESNIPYFTIIRQTAMIYLDMLTSNVNSGIMFHTPFNAPFEWSTAEDSARLMASIIREDLKGNLNYDNFWRKIFNLGGGEESRISGYETIQGGFSLFGGSVKDFYEPRFNITRNFHGGFFVDGDELEKLFHYRKDNINDYWNKIAKAHKELSFARIVPHKLIKKFSIETNFKDPISPAYWYKHNEEALLVAYFGSKEKYENLPQKWGEFKVYDYKEYRSLSTYKPIDYGFDIDKKDKDITLEDLQNVAKKHGGKLLSKSFKTGDVYAKLEWENSDGEKFTARPYTVFRGGHWYNPIYRDYIWDFDRLCKKDEIFAAFWYDSHDKDENHCYYFDENLKAKIR